MCRVFQPTKNAFVDTLRSVLDDIKWSLLFLVLTMWGFAGAFYILFREDQANYQVESCGLSLNKQFYASQRLPEKDQADVLLSM